VNVVTGSGDAAGQAIASHPDIRKISLTGSVATGRAVMAAPPAPRKQLTPELGGKNAQPVCPDPGLDRAPQGIMLGAFMNQGQVCTSGSRVFAHHAIADELQRRIIELTNRLRRGDPFDKTTEIGALTHRAHLERVLHFIEVGKSEGASVLAE